MLHKNVLEQPGAFQNFFENHPDGICVVDVDGHLLHVNASALRMFGYTREELLQTSFVQLLDWSGGSGENGEARLELAIPHKRGFFVYVRVTCIPLVSGGQEIGRFITFEDISQQRQQSEFLSNIQEMFLFISEKSQNIISSFSADGVFTYISPTVRTLLGYTPEEVIGKPAVAFNHPDDNEKLLESRSSVRIDQDTVRFTGRVRHKNGGYRWYETTVEFIRDQSGEIMQKICVGRDITDRKEAEETIAHQAYHDSLTNLPNRRLLQSRITQLLEDDRHELHGLMLLDLDGFKCVNDTFGHDTGDLLLIEVAKRLTSAVEENGFVARWGGDEFTVIRTNLDNRADMDALMERIKEVIARPIMIAGHTLSITASIGVSFFLEDGDTVEALIKNADAAMYRAKDHVKIR